MGRRGPPKDEALLKTVTSLVSAGVTPARIAEICKENHGASPRNVRRYIAEVLRDVEPLSREQIQTMLQRTHANAIAAGKHSAAISSVNALMKLRGPQAEDDRKLYERLGDPPIHDALACVEWAQKANAIALEQVIKDGTLTPQQRRDEMRKTSRIIAALVPQERIYDAEQTIRKDAEDLDAEEDDPAVTERDGKARGNTKSLRISAS